MYSNITDEIVRMKDSCPSLTWNQIAEKLNSEYNTDLTANAVRKRYYRGIESIVDSHEDTTSKLDEIKIERYKLQDERTQINAIYRTISREETIKEMAMQVADKMCKSYPLDKFDRRPTLISEQCKQALLLIGDWHYGMEVDGIYNKYNPEICYQRVQDLAHQVIKKIEKESIDELYVLNLGDMISGLIHAPLRLNTRLDVITQVMEVSELIADFLTKLSKYVTINYWATLDNHSRINPNKKEAIQLESLARFTHWYLKERLRNIDTIFINDNEQEDIAQFHIDGFSVVGVHGDLDSHLKVLKDIPAYIQERPDLICAGHIHHFYANEDNLTTLLVNGSLMGPDDYTQQKRLNSSPSQTLITFKETLDIVDIDGIYVLKFD